MIVNVLLVDPHLILCFFIRNFKMVKSCCAYMVAQINGLQMGILSSIGSYLLFCALTAGAWTSPSISKLNATDGPFPGTLTIDQSSWLGSLPILGSIVGPVLGGFLCDRLGRKAALLLYALPVTISYFTMAFAKVIWLFYISRFLIGLSLGSLFALTPIYVGEMSLNEQRGILSAVIGIFVNAGPLFALATGPYMSVRDYNLLLGCLPLIFIVEFFFIGLETPHFYIQKGKHEKAKTVLRKMRNGTDKEVEDEMDFLKHLIESREVGTVYDIFRSKGMIKALTTIVTLFTLAQLTGVMVIQTYAQQIFENAGTTIPAELCAIILGAVSLVTSTIIPVFTIFMGRKTMLISSGLATSFGQVLFGVYFMLEKNGTDMSSITIIPVILLMFIVVASGFGLIMVPIILLSEIFPNATKGVATNLSSSWSFIVSFVVSKYFPILVDSIGQGPIFIGFGVFTFSMAAFTLFFVIETKGKTLKDIQDELNS